MASVRTTSLRNFINIRVDFIVLFIVRRLEDMIPERLYFLRKVRIENRLEHNLKCLRTYIEF